MLREHRDQPAGGILAAELEDEGAHLLLGPAGEIADRAEVPADRARPVFVLAEGLLRTADVQRGGEQRLGNGVVQIARDAVTLLRRQLTLAALRVRQVTGGAFALADDGAEEEGGEGRDGDVE